MMERNEILISRIRESSTLTDKNGAKDSIILNYLNIIQREIRSIIFQAELEPDLFIRTLNVTPEEVTAELPEDCYLDNSILYVMPEGVIRKLNKIQSYERGNTTGYFLENKEIGFSSSLLNTYPSYTVKYFRRLPTLDIRRGKITARTSTTITLDTGYSTKIGVESDYVTVVDGDGEIIQAGIKVASFTTGVITSTGIDTTLVEVGHYVCLGKYASTHCELPEECENLLTMTTEKLLLARNVSKETATKQLFSDEQKDLLIGMFQGNNSDPIYPPITDHCFQ